MNLMQYNRGYDLLKSTYASIYPYAGISLRQSNLIYDKPTQGNPSYTNISDIVSNNQAASPAFFRFAWQVGIGVDVLVSKESGILFFTKFATDRPFGKEKFSVAGIDYQPGIMQADWLLGFGFKFTGPR